MTQSKSVTRDGGAVFASIWDQPRKVGPWEMLGKAALVHPLKAPQRGRLSVS
jgi:hypothetical protein